MDKQTKRVLIVVLIVVVILGSLMAVATGFFLYYLKDITQDTINLIEDCPYPAKTENWDPSEKEMDEMLDWCCKKYDSSSTICKLILQGS